MATLGSPGAESVAWGPPAASPRNVPSGQRESKLGGTSGQADGGGTSWGPLLQREDECWSPAASDGLRATQRQPGPTRKSAALRGVPCEAWLDPSEVPDTPALACSCPMWSGGEDFGTGGNGGSSSVSSGRLSGSSGGHECMPAHGLWKERPPQVLGSPKQPSRSDPRLERLRDKIRAQAAWQASCGSLGTSAPSSASRLCKGSKLAPRKKVRKVARTPVPQASPDFGVRRAAESQVEDKASPRCEPARTSQRPASVPREKAKRIKGCSCKRAKASKSPSPLRASKGKDSESVGVYAWRRGQDLVRLLLGPPPALPGRRSQAPSREPAPTSELGDSKKVPTAPAQTPSPACSDQRVSANTPSLVSWDQPVTIQTAMTILQELRQQIQAGLDLAQRPQSRRRSKHRRPEPGLQDPTETRQQGPGEGLDTPGAFFKRPWAMTEDKGGHSERTCSSPRQQPCSASAGWGASPKRAWDPAFQRPGSHPERQGSPLPRPWSTSAGQTCEDWDSPARWPWSPLEKPCSSSFVQPAGSPCKGSFSRDSPGKERAQELPAGQRPRGVPGSPHSSASLREFMRQKALARRQQMLEEKAAAVQALKLRDHRLREVYRKQREAVLGRPAPVVSLTRPSIVTFVPHLAPDAVQRPAAGPGWAAPVVSQTRPGIVTFVPHSAQDRDLDTPGSPGPPVLEWSKVTSGLMLGDQETPGSFCLCLNKAFSRPQTQTGKTKNGRPLQLSTNTSLRPWNLQDLPMNCSQPQQLCIYLDPKEAESLGAARPLHYQYRQARLQALETTANALKQRIDVLTEKLQKPEAVDVLGDLAPSLPVPLLPSPEPAATTLAAPDWPRALVPSGEAGHVSPLYLSDREALHLDSGQERWQRVSPWDQCTSKVQGLTGHRPSSELEPRLESAEGTFHPMSTLEGSSHQVPATLDAPCGSMQLEEVLAARKDGVGRPRRTGICGGQQTDGPLLGDLQNGLLANIRQKSWSFLESLKLDQWKQAWALALLRQRVEREVIETQTALDRLLLRPPLQRLAETHSTQSRPKTASELEQPPVRVDPELQWASAGPKQEAGGPNKARFQQPPTRLDPWESWRMQDVTDQGFRLQMLEQSLREEELRAQHQTALLRLREKALEEKVLAELAGLEHQRGCLGDKRDAAALAALKEQEQRILGDLQREQKELRYLRSLHLSTHRERRLLLQHQRDLASMQHCTAHLQRELWAGTTPPQGSGPQTSPKPEGNAPASSHPTPSRPCSPSSLHPPRNPLSLPSTHLLAEHGGVTPPRATWAANDHLPSPRPTCGEDTAAGDWSGSQGQLVESHSHTCQGHPQAKPSPALAEDKARTQTGSQAREWSLRPTGGEEPSSPQEQLVEGSLSREESELGLDAAMTPTEEPHGMDPRQSEAQRIETCLLEDTGPACSGPRMPGEEAPPERSPLPELTVSLERGSVSAPSTCSGFSSAGSSSSVSCPSLQEFQKVSAIRVYVSESSTSLPDLETEDSLDQGLSWAGGLSVHAVWEPLGHPSSEPQVWPTWGLHSGEPRVSGIPGDQGLEGRTSSEVAEVGSPAPVPGWLSPLPDASRPRSGSELSESSSKIWGEDIEEEFPGCGLAALGYPTAAESPSDLENGGVVSRTSPSRGDGGAQDASRTSSSLTIRSNRGHTQVKPPKVVHTAASFQASPTSDLDLSLSLSSGAFISGVDFGKEGETGLPPVLAGYLEGPQEATVTPLSPAGGPESQASKVRGSGAPRTPEEACPHLEDGVLPEILFPVDEGLSYDNANLPSSGRREPSPPPSLLEQTLPVEGGGQDPSICSEDFPPPPEEGLCGGSSPGTLGEDASVSTDELPSWPKESRWEPLCPQSPETGHLEDTGPGGPHEEELGEWNSVAKRKAVSGQWSLCWGTSDAQPTPPSTEAREGLPRLLVVGDRNQVRHQGHETPVVCTGPLGSWGASWRGVLFPESAEGPGGPVSFLVGLGEHPGVSMAEAFMIGRGPSEMLTEDGGAATPTHAPPAAPAAPLGAGSWPGFHRDVCTEAEGGLGFWEEEDHLGAKDTVPREPSLGRGLDRGEVVDMVSTQLTTQILRDSLAVVSQQVLQGSPPMAGGHREVEWMSLESPRLREPLLGGLGEAGEL